MKEVRIDGKRYNINTAEFIASWDNDLPYMDFGYLKETLYRKRTGEFSCTVRAVQEQSMAELMMMAEHTLAVRKSSRLQMQKREHGLKRMRKAIGH